MLARSKSDDEQPRAKTQSAQEWIGYGIGAKRADVVRAPVTTSGKRDVTDGKKNGRRIEFDRANPTGGRLAEDLPVTVRRRRGADSSAAQAADDGTRQRIAGRGAYKRTATGADGAAGQRALSWRVATSGDRQRQGSAHND